jgi:hypothetical protein
MGGFEASDTNPNEYVSGPYDFLPEGSTDAALEVSEEFGDDRPSDILPTEVVVFKGAYLSGPHDADDRFIAFGPTIGETMVVPGGNGNTTEFWDHLGESGLGDATSKDGFVDPDVIHYEEPAAHPEQPRINDGGNE